ncbi:MAG: BlaI/MecI/CopY family transcriptional regulator [Bacillota bacterium]|nr:BlaI/MecI/CopY family transcriptional regulator [Bacillota bacterium]
MNGKIFDSELKVLEVLWQNGATTARDMAGILQQQVGWRKTTTYTVIKKCLDKGIVAKEDPNFLCRPLVTREQVQKMETADLIDKMYDGAADQLIASLLDSDRLSQEQIKKLKRLVEDLE